LRLQGNYQYQLRKFTLAQELFQTAIPHASKTNDLKLMGDIYNNLGQTQIQLSDYAKAEANLKKALQYRKTLLTRDDEITTLNNLGLMFWQMQDYPQALVQYQAAARLSEDSDNIKLAASSFNNLGNTYLKTGNIASALEAYISSLELKKRFGTDKDIAVSSFSIGNLFYRSGDNAKALRYYQAARQLYLDIGETNEAKQVDGNLGVVYNALGEYDMAVSHHLSALEFYRIHNMELDLAKTLNNLGNVYQNQQKFSQALDYYKQSKTIKTRLNDQEGLAATEKNMGEVHYLSRDFEAALRHTLASLKISQQLKNKLLIFNNYRQLSKIQASLGDYESAWNSLQRYVELDHELHKQESLSAIAEMMNRLDTQDRIREISELRDDQLLKEAKIYRLAKQRLMFVLAALFMSLFIISLAVLYYQKKQEIHKGQQLTMALEKLNLELEERINHEIGKYRQQQQVINQKSKLESLGTLAAGIAHEINQPLSAISMSIDNLAHRSQLSRIDSAYLQKKSSNMRADVERIQSIIQHVRLFSRIQTEETIEQVDLNATIADTVTIFEPVLRKAGITIKADLCGSRILVLGNRFKLEQVLFNLLSNAKDAILEKYAEHADDQIKSILINCHLEDENVIISVCDKGKGISPEAQTKIFDPFYTTKSPDKGTGLGLSISYGIIDDMGGSLRVDSQPEEGSCFTISLPVLKA